MDSLHDRLDARLVVPGGGDQKTTRELGGHGGPGRLVDRGALLGGQAKCKHAEALARSCLDTAPTAFPAGTRVWFISYGSDVVNVPAPAVSPPNTLRFHPYNNRDEYPFGSCVYSPCEATPTPLNNHIRVTVETFDVDLNEAWRMLEWEFDRT